MINVKEIRIGNWLRYYDRNVIVTAIFKTHFRCESIDGISFDTSAQVNYYPIPLSPEILEACGFKKWTDETYELIINGNSLQIKDDTAFLAGESSMNNTMCFTCEAKYLHQLQNIYFALTGSELMIDEQKLQRSVATTAK